MVFRSTTLIEITDTPGKTWSEYIAAYARRPRMDRQTLSVSQLAELLGFETERFIGLQVNRQSKTVTLLLEPLDADKRNDASVGQ